MARARNRLIFRDAKTPISEKYDDVYFANEVGIEESIYNYIEGAGVLRAIRAGKIEIAVGEIGFGVALNFILTLRAFLTEAKLDQKLHYVSVEKFPIDLEDLRTLYSAYPELEPYAKLLLDQYPVLTPGMHRLFFANHRLVLDLMIGDAVECFRKHDFKVSHWYWDGFAPSKNPEAFTEELFTLVRARSLPLARGTSFTAAGWVRKSLSVSGFKVSKRKGFGRKRECIEAELPGDDAASASPNLEEIPAWFSNGALKKLEPYHHVAVIGAGLAGTAIARALADRGVRVAIFDGKGIASGASANTAALFNVQLSKKPNPISDFSQASLTHFLRELKALNIPAKFGIEREDEEAALCLDACDYPEDFFLSFERGALLPYCGMIQPRTLCEARISHSLIRFHPVSVAQVLESGDKFTLRFEANINDRFDEEVRYDHIIYAIGADHALHATPLKSELMDAQPVKAVRGQILLVRPTPSSEGLLNTRVNSGYVSPVSPEVTGHAFHLIGATYQAKDVHADQEIIDTSFLLDDSRSKWPEFASITEESVESLQVGYRASTPDKLPLLGPLSDASVIQETYAHALRGAKKRDLPALPVLPGQWAMMGMGSRGVTFSSLGAEILASMMTGFSLPIYRDLIFHLHPVRFTIRTVKKMNLS